MAMGFQQPHWESFCYCTCNLVLLYCLLCYCDMQRCRLMHVLLETHNEACRTQRMKGRPYVDMATVCV